MYCLSLSCFSSFWYFFLFNMQPVIYSSLLRTRTMPCKLCTPITTMLKYAPLFDSQFFNSSCLEDFTLRIFWMAKILSVRNRVGINENHWNFLFDPVLYQKNVSQFLEIGTRSFKNRKNWICQFSLHHNEQWAFCILWSSTYPWIWIETRSWREHLSSEMKFTGLAYLPSISKQS